MKFFYESELNPSIFRTPFTDMAVNTNNCITIIRLLLVNVHYTSLHLVNKTGSLSLYKTQVIVQSTKTDIHSKTKDT